MGGKTVGQTLSESGAQAGTQVGRETGSQAGSQRKVTFRGTVRWLNVFKQTLSEESLDSDQTVPATPLPSTLSSGSSDRTYSRQSSELGEADMRAAVAGWSSGEGREDDEEEEWDVHPEYLRLPEGRKAERLRSDILALMELSVAVNEGDSANVSGVAGPSQ